MNNFNVLLRYSLKPKVSSKKSILGIGGIFIFVAALIIIGGILATQVIETDNPLSSIIADEIYVYPENQLSTVILDLIPDSELIDSPQFTDSMIDSTADITIINTEDNLITSNFNLSTLAETTLTSIVVQAKNTVALQSIPEQWQTTVVSSQIPPNFESTSDQSENSDFLYGISFASTLIIFFVILFGIQLLGSEIFEEKNSRAMEIIITNVKPTTHMLVKITSTFLFILALGLAVLLGAVVGVVALKFISPDSIGIVVDMLVEYLKTANIIVNGELFAFIFLVLVSSILTILLFLILAAVTASMTTSYEDYQKANGPIIIFLLIPYFISSFDIEALSTILVYVPLFTPFFAPKLYLSAKLGIGGFGFVVLIQLIAVIVLFKLAAPIYREGLLSYSTSSFRQIFKRAYK